jgi:hypothetical protein
MQVPGGNRLMRTSSVCCALTVLWLSPAAAQAPPRSLSLLDAPHVRIGVVDGPPETTFGGVVGAVRLPTGHIAVADGGSHVVRFFDASGRHVGSVGREGSGPGEFQQLSWLGVCGGELLAVDPILSRAVRIAVADRRVMGHANLPPQIRFNPWLSCVADDHALVLMNRPQLAGARGQVERVPAAVLRVSLGTGAQDTLARLPGTDFYYAVNLPAASPVPLGASALAAAGGGRVFALQNNEEQVQVVDLATGARSAFRVRLPEARMSAVAWEAAVTEFIERHPAASTRQTLEAVLAEVQPPREHPRILDAVADRRGRLWLRPAAPAAPGEWYVYEPDGRHSASVRLPAGATPVDIGETHLVAVDRDSLGVETILVYALPDGLARAPAISPPPPPGRP